MTWDVVLGYFTGLHLLNPDLDPATLLRTAAVIHVCDAIMCRLFAHNNGYSKNGWTVLGLVFGIWALAVLIVLPKRTRGEGRGARDGSPPQMAPDGHRSEKRESGTK